MQGKTAVVTGANAGLGFETTRALVNKGAKVLMLCRNPEKGEEARQRILLENPGSDLEVYQIDLSSQADIRRIGNQIREKEPVIDVLVNNAGTWISNLTFTEEGIEKMWAVNHLAYFLMTHLLYPSIRKADDGRIVCVASDSHFQWKRINFDDVFLQKRYNGLRAYAQSKLANILFTYELDRRKPDDNVSTYAIQPGLVKTDIGLKHTNLFHALAWKVRRSSGQTPEQGARCQVFCATAPEAKGQSGKYWDAAKPKKSSKTSYEQDAWERLWALSKEQCGIEDFFEPKTN